MLLVGVSDDQPVRDEAGQPRLENVAGDSEIALEVVEPVHPHQ